MDGMTDGAGIFEIIALGTIVICCIAGIILQIFASRHRKPGIPRLGHKDALFKKKDLYYTETGMKYVEMQKYAMYIMAAMFILFLFTAEQPPVPPPE